MVGGHLRPAAGEFDARGPRFGPGRVFRRVIGKKFEVGADGTRVVGGVFGVALSDGNIGSEVYGDSGAAFEMFDTIFQLLERFQPPHPQGRMCGKVRTPVVSFHTQLQGCARIPRQLHWVQSEVLEAGSRPRGAKNRKSAPIAI